MILHLRGPTLRRIAIAAAIMATVAAAALITSSLPQSDPVRPAAELRWAESEAGAAALDAALDADNDGLSDLEETYVWGSDPDRFSTAGSGIPDGWLARYGFDPTRPGWDAEPMAAPQDPPAAYGRDDSTLHTNLLDVYRFARPADWAEERDGPWHNNLDPRRISTSDGISVAWLLHHGLDPREPDIGSRILPGDGLLNVRDNWLHGTDPHLKDTDGDGLPDSDEVHRHETDPLRFSTTGSGIPDGFLVRWGLDPLDSILATRALNGKGMTVSETYVYNEQRFGRDGAIQGQGVDPRKRSSTGLVPDGWLEGHGLDPLKPGVESNVLRRASDYPYARNIAANPAAATPAIPDFTLTVAAAYFHGRPASWDEAQLGPWRGGLDPVDADTDGDGLADVVELRGWFINRTTGFGASLKTLPVRVQSDPTLDDTDGDGLRDGEEYFGAVQVGDVERRFAPSDPSQADTAFSGMTDGEKVLGHTDHTGKKWVLATATNAGKQDVWLQPNRTDTAGSGIPDGVNLRRWIDRSHEEPATYLERTPLGACGSYLEAFARIPWVNAQGIIPTAAAVALALAPDGDLDGDGTSNVLDPDADGDGLLDGWEGDPSLLAFSEFASPFPRAATDPANPDTDCDGLPDAWELRFAAWDAGQARWDLDATKARSDGSTLDGDANLDADGADWYSYRFENGVHVPQAQRFEFTNAAEFQAGTNPRVVDEDRDGIPDAWPFFWGTVYPALLQNPASAPNGLNVGDLRPDLAHVLAEAPRLALGNPNLASSSKQAEGEPYWRFERATNPTLDPQRQELAVRVDTVTHARTGLTGPVATVEGRFVLTFRDEAGLSTNPYLLDTDGDGLPDAWEAFTSTCFLATGARSPDAVTPDANQDTDGDRRTHLQEYGFGRASGAYGTNPCVADTDLGGLDDGQELFLGLNPLRPADDATASSGGHTDTDGDGLVDRDEVLLNTDPLSVDTDRDGLLDAGDIRVMFPQDQPLPAQVKGFLERGIAHSRQVADGVVTYVFKGEATVGSSPTKASTAGEGIPDGWKVAYGIPVNQKRSDLLANYAYARPSWWSEPVHGVWWWGLPPNAQPGTRDADSDGLDDFNGEDPVPAARTACCLTRPHPTMATGSEEAWLLGQAYGQGAGNPLPVRAEWATADYDGNGIPDAHDRAQTSTIVTSIEQPPGTVMSPTSVLQKGAAAPFLVKGRVTTDCRLPFTCTPGQGIPNRAVAAYLEAPFDKVPVGYGVTQPDGTFAITACICPSPTFNIPAPGIAIRSQTEGTVAWAMAAADVPLGDHKLIVRSFNTTNTFWNDATRDSTHPHWLSIAATHNGRSVTAHATAASASQQWPIHVGSAAVIRLSHPLDLPWTGVPRTLTVDMTLEDATGRPLPDRILAATFAGVARSSAPTGTDGRTKVAFPIAADDAIQAAVQARFAGEPPLLAPGQTDSIPFPVQGPSHMVLDPVTPRIGTGEPLTIHGRLAATTKGLAAQPVHVAVTPEAGAAVAANLVTQNDGRFSLTLTVPDSFRGTTLIRASFPGSPLHAASEATATTLTVSGTHLAVTSIPVQVKAGTPFLLNGKLSDRTGASLDDHVTELHLPSGAPLIATTQTGSFQFSVNLSAQTLPGPVSLLLVHPEQGEYARTTLDVQLRVARPTRIELDAGSATPGANASLGGRLVDAAGQPLGGQAVTMTVAGQDLGRTLTDSSGRFHALWNVPRSTSLGPVHAFAEFAGSADGRFAANKSNVAWTIRDGSRIIIEPAQQGMPRDALRLQGSLRTNADAPIPGVDVTLYQDDSKLASAKTGEQGQWSILFSLPPDRSAGEYAAQVRYVGNQTLAPVNATTQVRAQAATSLAATVPNVLARGQTVEIPIALREQGGPPVAPATIHWRFGSGNGSTIIDTADVLALAVPDALPIGPTSLVLEYRGDAYRTASRHESNPVIRSPAFVEILDAPRHVETGETLLVRARLLGPDGEPVPAQAVGLVLDPARPPILGTTDATGVVAFPVTASGAGETTFLIRYAGNEALAGAYASTTVDVATPVLPRPAETALVAGLVIASLVAGAAAWAWLRLRPITATRSALQKAADQLVAGDDASAAILLAYEKLSRTLRRYGYLEGDSETASEFLAGLLRFLPTSPEDVSSLADLFNRARYGTTPLTSNARQTALSALHTLLADLDLVVYRLRTAPRTVNP